MRKLLLSLTLAIALAIGSAASALAAPPPYTDTVVGIETAVPTGASPFAGTASGQLPGLWSASVVHGSLPGPGGYGEITGGSFTLVNGSVGIVTGTFANSTTAITLVGGAGSCTQTFHVKDKLTLSVPRGSGDFDAYLTHYGFRFAGQCRIFFATIHDGIVHLTF
jgi:hypothetical protein